MILISHIYAVQNQLTIIIDTEIFVKGRGYGGVAIYWWKELDNSTRYIQDGNERIALSFNVIGTPFCSVGYTCHLEIKTVMNNTQTRLCKWKMWSTNIMPMDIKLLYAAILMPPYKDKKKVPEITDLNSSWKGIPFFCQMNNQNSLLFRIMMGYPHHKLITIFYTSIEKFSRNILFQ